MGQHNFDGKHLARAIKFVDEMSVTSQGTGSLRQAIDEIVPGQHGADEKERVIFNLDAQKNGVHQGEQDHHQKWIQQDPNVSYGRRLVACDQFLDHESLEQFPVIGYFK